MPRPYKRRKKSSKVKEVKVIEDVELNASQYHETVDRISVVESNIATFILSSPVLESAKHIKEKAKVEIAAQLLADVYQDLGQYL